MSREAYQIPSSSSGGGGGGGMGGAPGQGTNYSRAIDPSEGAIMHYLCGDCGFKLPLRRSDPIRCKECGCRVLYKERTKRMVQFEAR